jgi:lysyl-tRNA synthetase class 2
LALYSIAIGLVHSRHHHASVAVVTSSWSRSETYVFLVLVGITLLALSTRLSRGLRAAAWIAAVGAGLLAVVSVLDGNHVVLASSVAVVAVLMLVHGVFTVDLEGKPPWKVLSGAAVAWALLYGALLAAPSERDSRSALGHSFGWLWDLIRDAGAYIGASSAWRLIAEAIAACAAVLSVLAVRILLRPLENRNGHTEREHRAARAILDDQGADSLTPFLLRPDKTLLFEQDAVLAYQTIGDAAIVSGDPAAPDDIAPLLLARMRQLARERGWRLIVWGASERYLDVYRRLGMHAVHAGDEAIADPARFTLEGRARRKVRQSVRRVERRGWDIAVREGRDLDRELEREIEAVERQWRSSQRRILGFAMSMGSFDPEIGPDDVYALGRAPDGELRAVMRFASHCGNLSLDTMRRVGDTPNGLNEALICSTLEFARDRDVSEVSLNYAGLAHLVRARSDEAAKPAAPIRLALSLIGRRFQMERLVAFNEKFSPEWRPRFLVYESPMGLPRAVVRVLQAEGYIAAHWPAQMLRRRRRRARAAAAGEARRSVKWPVP